MFRASCLPLPPSANLVGGDARRKGRRGEEEKKRRKRRQEEGRRRRRRRLSIRESPPPPYSVFRLAPRRPIPIPINQAQHKTLKYFIMSAYGYPSGFVARGWSQGRPPWATLAAAAECGFENRDSKLVDLSLAETSSIKQAQAAQSESTRISRCSGGLPLPPPLPLPLRVQSSPVGFVIVPIGDCLSSFRCLAYVSKRSNPVPSEV